MINAFDNKKKKLIIGFIAIILVITFMIEKFLNNKNEKYDNISVKNIVSNVTLSKESKESITEKIKIHISGEVNNPRFN